MVSLIAALALLMVALAALLHRVRGLEARLRVAQAAMAAQQSRPIDLDPTFLAGADRVISVEILNPLALAANKGGLAASASALAPGLVRGMVHDQAVKTLRRQLAAQGVEAEVRIHAGR